MGAQATFLTLIALGAVWTCGCSGEDTVTVSLGETAILPCFIVPGSVRYLKWVHAETRHLGYVYLYENDRANYEPYVYWVQTSTGLEMRRNASLSLSNVTATDVGTYICYVILYRDEEADTTGTGCIFREDHVFTCECTVRLTVVNSTLTKPTGPSESYINVTLAIIVETAAVGLVTFACLVWWHARRNRN